MTSTTVPTKTFLFKNYMILFLGTVIATGLLGAVISTLQMRSVHGLYLERLSKVIALHQNELLNEIALEDKDALAQHLDIIRSELAIDSVTLKTKGISLSSSEPEQPKPWSILSIPEEWFFEAIGVKPLTIAIANDFDSVNANLTVVYVRNFSEWVVDPFLSVTYILFVFTLLTVALIFARLFRKIDHHLIKPLQRVTESFQGTDTSRLLGATENALGEIQALAEASGKLRKAERSLAFSELAHQVAHDIRSPLTLLNIIASEASDLTSENKKLLGLASARINKIASELLDKYRGHRESPKVSNCLVLAVAERIVLEKQAMHRASGSEITLEVDSGAVDAFVGADPTELGRAISNLIENGVEASVESDARVAIRVAKTHDGMICIEVSDNGRGIPADRLAQIGQKGVTHGKANGNGLGVYHARSLAEKAGGKCAIESEVGMGSVISLTFPRLPAPPWFTGSLSSENDKLITLDDDPTIHAVWRHKLGARIQATFTEVNDDLKGLIGDPSLFFLVDNQISLNGPRGIDFIEENHLGGRAILVTSDFEDEALQARCSQVGCKMIPKPLIPHLGLHRSPTQTAGRFDLVLIDNDELMRMSWQIRGRNLKKTVGIFENAESFIKADVARETPIYIDFHLDNGVSGIDVAAQLNKLGYKSLVITTGDDRVNDLPPYIKSVQGKDFPAA